MPSAPDSPLPLPPPSGPVDRPLAGVLWMVLSGLCFVGVTAVVKYLGPVVPPAQSAFLRYLIGLVFVLPALPALRAAQLGGRGWAEFGLRGTVHAIGVACWFYAMTRITLAEVTAIGYLSPVLVTLGAALFLGEALRLRRLVAVVVAIAGALIVLRPGFRELSPGHLTMLGTALFFAISAILAKRLTDRYPPAVMVAMLSLFVTLALAPLAAAVWVPVSWQTLAWLTLVACFATAGHYTMMLAFTAAPLGVTQPVTALQLVWAVLLGAVMFNEAVDAMVVLGGAVVAGAVVFIALREQHLRRAQMRQRADQDGN